MVKDYFNKSGFERWKKIYGETDDVNRVQRDIRLGHSKTVENVMKMLTDEGKLEGVTVCDAGCGTGCLAIPLAKEGAIVTAADISAAMVAEAEKQVSFYEVKRLLLWLWVLEGNLKFDGIGPIGNVGFGGNGICLSGLVLVIFLLECELLMTGLICPFELLVTEKHTDFELFGN